MALAGKENWYAATITKAEGNSYEIEWSKDKKKSTNKYDEVVGVAGILAAIADLSKIVDGTKDVSAEQWPTVLAAFTKESHLLDAHDDIMNAALDFVDLYEAKKGPLFMNDKTRGGFDRRVKQSDGKELERAMMVVQQTILDTLYSSSTLADECESVFIGRRWKTSAFFPGHVDPPSGPSTSHKVTIRAVARKFWGRPVAFAGEAVTKPTGLYLAPGSVAKVKMPKKVVGKAYYKVVVGAHVSDNTNKDRHLRMDRITTSFDVKDEETTIANPLGGGIYIIVPYLADDGNIDVEVSGGVVQAPIFSMTSVRQTTPSEWETMRTAPGPWADFETNKFMMQVPRVWMYAYSFAHVKALMEKYDAAMDGNNELAGYYGTGFHKDKHVLWIQPDLHIRHVAYGIGYPQVNILVNSNSQGHNLGPRMDHADPLGKSKQWMVNSPTGWYVTYHELGHAQLPTMYRGETEAINNFYLCYIRNIKEQVSFDTAFADTLSKIRMTPDRAAII